jgi:serine/threonine protein kinase
MWASMPSVSKLAGTTSIFCAFWMGFIRCDCPGPDAFDLTENRFYFTIRLIRSFLVRKMRTPSLLREKSLREIAVAGRVGQQFGNYRLLSLLGCGGFAEVYLGQHLYISSQKAALKILSSRLLNQANIQVFKQEAETIASLDHPHIVRILDFGVTEGIPFLVMNYAPHGSLRDRYQQGEQAPLLTVISYVQQVADGLQYAHEKRLIHCDIKPENMLVDVRHEVVLSDFGIAKIAHSTSSQSMQSVVGTFHYMAPEQFEGKPQPASDQYALGITIYEWLTGEYPFTGTIPEIIHKHLKSAPSSICERRPDIPKNVEQAVFIALAKEPNARFRSVQEFAQVLAGASQGIVSNQPKLILSGQAPSSPFTATIPVLPAIKVNRDTSECVVIRYPQHGKESSE